MDERSLKVMIGHDAEAIQPSVDHHEESVLSSISDSQINTRQSAEEDPNFSTSSEDWESDDSDRDLQHSPIKNGLKIPIIIYDSDRNTASQQDDEVNNAAAATFAKGSPTGGIYIKLIGLRSPSGGMDLGELMYTDSRSDRSPKSTSSISCSTWGPQDTANGLEDRLFMALQKCREENQDFFPKRVLSTIITEKCVRTELAKTLNNARSKTKKPYDKQAIAQYAKQICGEIKDTDESGKEKLKCFRKIFMILVLVEKTSAVVKFLRHDVNDSDLPLEKVERPEEKGAYDLRLAQNPTKRLKCFSGNWTQLNIRNFEQYQWTTLSPFFRKGGHNHVEHQSLHDQTILPFITDGTGCRSSTREQVFEGGFGSVLKVDIHPDHHNFDRLNKGNQSFAIKRLHSPDKERFMKEVEVLKKISNPAHDHLITLLATYEHCGQYCLIFHWAEADLQRYWKDENPTPSMNRDTVLWFAEQCKGIADGLMKIHLYRSSDELQPQREIFGHHGDIKPQNVLWFKDPNHSETKGGILKLSDFGLAEFNLHRTMSMKPKSIIATSPFYRAPEVDLTGTGAIGRSYDIWTLGCLYLEFITWMLGGWDLVAQFAFERVEGDIMFGQPTTTFFRLVVDGNEKWRAEMKPAVINFINKLHGHESCSKFLHDFLDMVQKDMLVIEEHDPEKRGRITIQEVHKKLADMLRHWNANEDYGCKPAPRLDGANKRVEGQHTSNLPALMVSAAYRS